MACGYLKTFTIFAPALRSGGQGVIEIIFIREILAKFPSREDNRQWHRIIGLYSHHWLFTYPLVWSIVFISDKGNARSLTRYGKDN